MLQYLASQCTQGDLWGGSLLTALRDERREATIPNSEIVHEEGTTTVKVSICFLDSVLLAKLSTPKY